MQVWKNLRKGEGTIAEYQSFLAKHADWPDVGRIVAEGEKKILAADMSVTRDVSWFTKHAPMSSKGWIRYVDALKAGKKPKEKIDSEVRKAWAHGIDVADENSFYQKWGKNLTTKDHTEREYRLMLLGSSSPLARSNKAHVYPCALSYQVIRGHLKAREYDLAHALLKANLNEIKTVHPNMAAEWWRVRHAVARECLEKGQWNEALELVQHHGLVEGTEDWATAEWTRGWFLWHTQQFDLAFKVFSHAYGKVRAPTSRSRMAFWAAESAKSMGQPDVAQQWHTKSTHYACSFYGQLSVRVMDQKLPDLFWAEPTGVKFKKDDLYNVIIGNNELTKDEMLMFFQAWLKRLHHNHAPTDPIFAKVVELAHQKGGDMMAVAVMRLVNFVSPLFVKKAFPTLPGVASDIALVSNAIAWRESGFDPQAVSCAGAIGLMQVMPGTFDLEKKKMESPPTESIYVPAANVIVGTHIIKRLMQTYPHILMSLGAYNAGEDPVARWVQVFGEPPNMDADPILIADWVEKIPYYETRNYVQRVLEKVCVYRIILGEGASSTTPIAIA